MFGWRWAMRSIGGLAPARSDSRDPEAGSQPASDMGLLPGRRRLRSLRDSASHLEHSKASLSLKDVLQHACLLADRARQPHEHRRDRRRDPAPGPLPAGQRVRIGRCGPRVLSVLLVSSLAGRIVMGWLADRFPKKYVMLAACLCVACAVPLLYAPNLGTIAYIFAAIFGFGMGADYMMIPLITAECFGLRSLGRIMGIIITTDSVGQAFAPVIVGRIFDSTKSYSMGFRPADNDGQLSAHCRSPSSVAQECPLRPTNNEISRCRARTRKQRQDPGDDWGPAGARRGAQAGAGRGRTPGFGRVGCSIPGCPGSRVPGCWPPGGRAQFPGWLNCRPFIRF